MDYNLKDILVFLGIVVFIMLILWDIGISLWRGAFWVPGEALVLTGLTIQILGYIETQNISGSKVELQSLVESQLSIDCARVTMCVFVGFLLPRMATASTGTKWSNIVALLASISTHIATEVYAIHDTKDDVRRLKKERVSWFIGSGGVLLLSIIGLVVLLGYVVIAGKFISETLSRRIRHCLTNNDTVDVDNLNPREIYEYKILKTWWVTRVCQPEYVIARSTFGAATGGIVTCCVVLFAVKVILLRSLVKKVPLFSLHCVFILIGWTFIFHRWLTSVLYFQNPKKFWYNCTHVFLAGISRCYLLQKIVLGYAVFDLMGINSAVWLKLKEYNCNRKIKVYLKSICIVIRVLISPFLVIPWLLLYFTTAVVTFLVSMFFWGLLAFLCGKIIGKAWKSKPTSSESDLQIYVKVLDAVVIYGEDPENLLIVNSRSFRNIKRSMESVFDKGRGWKELIDLMGSNNLEENFADQLNQFVDGRPEVKERLEYFPGVKERTWRITALSLVKMIVEVGNSVSLEDKWRNKIVEEAVLAYKQARDLMEFADFPENVAVRAESFSTSNLEAFLLRYQAQRDYKSLKNVYRHSKSRLGIKDEDNSVVEALDRCSPKLFEWSAFIKDPLKQSLYTMNLATDPNDPCQSICSDTHKHFDGLMKLASIGYACWEDVAPTYSLLQVSDFIKEKEIDDHDVLLDTLRNYLANVVDCCLSDLTEQILESCNKWAAEFEEEKISKAINLAAKAWALKEAKE